jgi:hypothetical protein
MALYKGFLSCDPQERLQPGHPSRRSPVRFLYLAGLASRCSAFENFSCRRVWFVSGFLPQTMITMIYKVVVFLVAALSLANCCALGTGCVPVAGTAAAWDGLDAAATEDAQPVELRPKQHARKKRDSETTVAEPHSKSQSGDSWGQQQTADQIEEARLKRKLMICQSCLPKESARDDTAGVAGR